MPELGIEIGQDRYSEVLHDFGVLAYAYLTLVAGGDSHKQDAFTLLKKWGFLAEDGEIFPEEDEDSAHS